MAAQAASLQADLDELFERIQHKEIAVFCAAGISRKSGIPIVHDSECYIFERLAAYVPGEAFLVVLERKIAAAQQAAAAK